MRHRLPPTAVASLSILALLAAGCASQRAMETSARSAADQIALLKMELQQKVDAETTYYDRTLKEVGAAIDRSLDIRVEQQLQDDAASFVDNAGTVTGEQIVTYMQTAVTHYQTTETALQEQLDAIRELLDDRRQKLSLDTARLSALQSKLSVLAEARGKKQLAGFVFGFVTQTADELARLEEPPSDSPAPTP